MYAIDALYSDQTNVLPNDGITIDIDAETIMGSYDDYSDMKYLGGVDEFNRNSKLYIELAKYNGPEEIKLLESYGFNITKNGGVSIHSYNNIMSDDYDMVPEENSSEDLPNMHRPANDNYRGSHDDMQEHDYVPVDDYDGGQEYTFDDVDIAEKDNVGGNENDNINTDNVNNTDSYNGGQEYTFDDHDAVYSSMNVSNDEYDESFFD